MSETVSLATICTRAPHQRSTANHASEQVWLVQATVAHAMDIPFTELFAPTRQRPKAALARQLGMYLCHTVFSVGVSDTARAFGRNPATVTHALRRIEDMRDDTEFDQTLNLLEAELQTAWGDA